MRSSTRRGVGLIAAWLVASCGGDDGGGEAEPPGSTGISLSMGGTMGSGESPSAAEDDTGPRLDVGGAATMAADDGGAVDGCQKVDVILAVDNSGSMLEEHMALQGPVFDSFPQTLLAINDGIDDFHLAVIDACPKPAYFHDTGAAGACNYSTGANYMISSSPELAAEFACVTEFALDGYMGQPDMCIDGGQFADDDEQPGLTAAQAVTGAAAADVNTGFLRDDALLFIVTITDEDEEVLDVGSTQEIYDQIVAAKGGNADDVVYLGIAGGSQCEGPYGTAENAVQSRALAELFMDGGQGLFWDLCDGELETAFQVAIEDYVDSACQDFIPPA